LLTFFDRHVATVPSLAHVTTVVSNESPDWFDKHAHAETETRSVSPEACAVNLATAVGPSRSARIRSIVVAVELYGGRRAINARSTRRRVKHKKVTVQFPVRRLCLGQQQLLQTLQHNVLIQGVSCYQ